MTEDLLKTPEELFKTPESHWFDYDWLPYAGDLYCLQVTEMRPLRDGDERAVKAAQSSIMIPMSEVPSLYTFIHGIIVDEMSD